MLSHRINCFYLSAAQQRGLIFAIGLRNCVDITDRALYLIITSLVVCVSVYCNFIMSYSNHTFGKIQVARNTNPVLVLDNLNRLIQS